ncbi:MAG: type II/IV secretion system ATPase subunit [Candidatus Aenigmatarchaeota archaeon]|nr:type II/IV secretion system ATPase subunit [Candidatus Aenigmarchaeota archaeon]
MLGKLKRIFSKEKKIKSEEKIARETRASLLLKSLRPEEERVEKTKKSESSYEFPKFKIFTEKKPIITSIQPPIRYSLIYPYAFALIRKDPISGNLLYHVIEPSLYENEEEILEKIKRGLNQIIDISPRVIKNREKMIEFLEEKVQNLLSQYGIKISKREYLKIMYYIYRDFVGLNEIEPLMNDPFIEDISVDGINLPVYVVHQKLGSIKTNIIYNDIEKLREFVVKLAERCDRYISYAEPLLDGSLPDGSRVQATLTGDVTTRGPTFSIRKFKEEPLSPIDLIMLNTASTELMAYLWYLIEAKRNIMICGGTSTGKTSLLNAISVFIPYEAKIVSIEDTRELMLPHEHWVPGVARPAFGASGIGEITMFDLLRESFRQNPDYLVVGEIRGKEAYVMFQGMASGHPSFATMHAASLEDMIKRLESPPIELSPYLIEILDIVIIMIHAKEKGKSARRIKEVLEIQNIDKATGNANAIRAFTWIPAEDRIEFKGYSWVLNKISIDKGISMREIYRDIEQRKMVLDWLVKNNIRSISKVAKYVEMFYKERERLMKIIKEVEE